MSATPNLICPPEKLREAFQQSLKTSAFRPKFDFKAFDFLEALVEHRQNEKMAEHVQIAR